MQKHLIEFYRNQMYTSSLVKISLLIQPNCMMGLSQDVLLSDKQYDTAHQQEINTQ